MTFLGEFLSNPAATGAVAPSSSFLARTMLEGLDIRHAQAILEYGPGTGSFTASILEGKSRETKFAAIELNPRLADIFKSRYPGVQLFQDSVANVRAICDYAGIADVDCIISGLPWAAFSESMQRKFLDQMMRVLRPGGHFVTFAYVHGVWLPPGKRFAELLPQYFAGVSRSNIVWLNLPPAFVYRCRR